MLQNPSEVYTLCLQIHIHDLNSTSGIHDSCFWWLFSHEKKSSTWKLCWKVCPSAPSPDMEAGSFEFSPVSTCGPQMFDSFLKLQGQIAAHTHMHKLPRSMKIRFLKQLGLGIIPDVIDIFFPELWLAPCSRWRTALIFPLTEPTCMYQTSRRQFEWRLGWEAWGCPIHWRAPALQVPRLSPEQLVGTDMYYDNGNQQRHTPTHHHIIVHIYIYICI